MKSFLKIAALLLILLLVVAGSTFYFDPLWVADQQIRLHLWHNGVQSRYIQAGNYRLHYFEAAPPNGVAGVPLVLIHGLGSRGEDWSPMIPTLAAHGFHVYAPDLPGYGRSPRPDADYSIAFQSKAVVDFMHAVQLTQADVIGWSMGGWVAAKLTLDHPELVDRLGLFDAAGVYFPFTFNASLFLPENAAQLNYLSAMLSPNPRHIPQFAVSAGIRRLQSNRTVIERSVDQMLSGRDLLDFRLHLIQKPTLIVWGGDDRLIPLSTGETMHHDIEESVLFVVQGCGHLAPDECSKPIVQETIAYLAANPAPARTEITVPKPLAK